MSLAELCSLHEVSIERNGEVRSSSGASRLAYSTANRDTGTPTTNVGCRIVPLSSERFWTEVGEDNRQFLMKEGMHFYFKVHFATDPQVDTRDRLKYGTRFLYVKKVENIDEWSRKWTVFCCEDVRSKGPTSS